jgi:suppressor for copper-sensitivity B
MNLEHLTSPRKRRYFGGPVLAVTLSLLSALVFSLDTAKADTNASGWKANSEARTRLLTPFGLEEDGRTIWIGLEIDLEPGWHSYWKNPGDAGLPPAFPEIDADYISNLEVHYPPPKFYPFGRGLDANGYANGVIYPIELTLTDKALNSEKIPLNLGLFYLVCKDLCIPHDETFAGELSLNRQGSENSSAPYADKMRKALALLPKSPAEVPEAELRESLSKDGEDYILTIAFRSPISAEKFPSIFFHQTPTLKLGTPEFKVSKDQRDVIITVVTTPVQTKVSGETLDTVTIGYLLTNVPTQDGVISIEKVAGLKVGAELATVAGSVNSSGSASSPSESGISLWKMLFFAFLGGLILNIMPCVLPVLSIKLMSILSHSGDTRSVITRGMLLSSGGIVTSFLLLASAALIAKSAGASIGWGVQFQEPAFVAFLALVVFLFGLNLWGVFEVTLPSSVSTGAVKASQRGHFTQGMLATLLATPCSAPFLGSAVGFAFASPAPIVFSIFFALGLGMSAPYLTLAAFPKAVRFLPKPGAWMEKAKGFFGFLLMATVIWLMFVLSGQIDTISLALVWIGLLLVALIIWGKQALAPYASFFTSAAGLATVALVVGASALTIQWAVDGRSNGRAKAISTSQAGIQWRAFSERAIQQSLDEGKVVFVDVTADWCWTCKLNEKLFLETDEVVSLLNENNIVALQADWTNRSKEIGDFLARYGRSGIPFYIVYYGGNPNNFITLPVTITKGTLTEALNSAVEKNQAFSKL